MGNALTRSRKKVDDEIMYEMRRQGMTDKRDKALEWIERQIRQARQALGRAEYKPGVKPEELENLSAKIELLEFISGEVLKVDGADGWISVKDRLPDENDTYIVAVNDGVQPLSLYWLCSLDICWGGVRSEY